MQHKDSHKTSWSLLAGWRFLLASTVVLGHYFLMVRPDTLHLFRADLLNPSSAVFGFFLLSGYSIAASIDREQTGFYRRRVLRIWPLYVAAIVFGVTVQWTIHLSPSHPFTWPLGEQTYGASAMSVAVSLLMLQSVVCGPVGFDGPLWSLSPEWWHYMVAPKLRKLSTPVLAFLIAASFLAYIFIAPANAGIETLANWRVLVVTSWMWMTGFLYFRLRRTPIGFTVLALPATLSIAIGRNWGLPLLFSIFVLVVSTEVRVTGAAGKFLNLLGDVSYPLYLFHVPMMIALLAFGVNNSFVLLLAPVALATVVLKTIDLPLRSRFSSDAQRSPTRANASHPGAEDLELAVEVGAEAGD